MGILQNWERRSYFAQLWSALLPPGRRWCRIGELGVSQLEAAIFFYFPSETLIIYLSVGRRKKNKSLNLPLKTKNKTELLLRGGDIWAICLVSLATAQSRLHKVHKPTLTKHAYLSGKGWSLLDIQVNWRKFLKKWRSAE